jgi:hypothetical protein
MKVSTEIDNNFGYEKKYAAGRQYPFNPIYFFQDGSTLPASQRAYHPDELNKSETLKIGKKAFHNYDNIFKLFF